MEQGEGKVICGVSCSPVSCVTALNASCGQESSHMLLAVYRFPISSGHSAKIYLCYKNNEKNLSGDDCKACESFSI